MIPAVLILVAPIRIVWSARLVWLSVVANRVSSLSRTRLPVADHSVMMMTIVPIRKIAPAEDVSIFAKTVFAELTPYANPATVVPSVAARPAILVILSLAALLDRQVKLPSPIQRKSKYLTSCLLTDQRILTGSSSSHSSFNSNPFSGNRQTIVTGTDSFGGSFSSAPAVSSSFGSGGSSFGSSSSSFSPASGSSFSGSSSSFGDDPCANFNCGSNANCLLRSFRAVCGCRAGYEGDPYTGCRRSECVGKFETTKFY